MVRIMKFILVSLLSGFDFAPSDCEKSQRMVRIMKFILVVSLLSGFDSAPSDRWIFLYKLTFFSSVAETENGPPIWTRSNLEAFFVY